MLLLSCSIGKVRSLPVKSCSAGISRWKPSQSSVPKARPSMPTLSRSRRQVASSRPPNSQARVRRAAGSKARQSRTLFFSVHEVPHLVGLHDLARRLARRLRRGLAGRAQPPVDRDVADAQELGDHALAGVAHGVEQDRQGLHGLGLAALRRGGEVAAAGLAEVALVAPYRAVLDERRPGAPLAAHLDQPCPPDPAVEPSYQTVDLWVNVSPPDTQFPDGLSDDGGPLPPGGQFLLGTDLLGRDLLSRLIYGARTSLIIGV